MEDFDAFNASLREERGDAYTFKLAGREWSTRPARDMPVGTLVKAGLIDEDLSFAHTLLFHALGVDVYNELLAATEKADQPVLPGTLIEVARKVVQFYTGRPTTPSSRSSAGPQRSGGGSKKTSRRKASAA